MPKLSERLQAVADRVKHGEPAADIGSDHAYLPIYLLEQGMVPWAIAGELGDGPYERALQAVKQSNLQEKIYLRQGDGLQVLAAAEVSTVIIAGLGGESIVSILAYDWQKACSFKHFIFQPMSRAGILRKTLAEKGWPILDESLIIENDHYYPIVLSRPGFQPYYLDELQAEIGPQILQADSRAKRGFIASYVEKYGKVYNRLKLSQQPDNIALAQNYLDWKRRLEVLLDASHCE